MKFCPECGSNVVEMKFCPNCGMKIPQSNGINNTPTDNLHSNDSSSRFVEKVLWSGKQSKLFGLNEKLRYKATDSIEVKMKEDRYEITNYVVRIIHESTTKTDEEVYNFEDIKDVKVKQTLKDKVQGIGDLVIYLMNGNEVYMKGINDPDEPKRLIMQQALEYQRSRNIMYRKDL
ncbi:MULTISPECIES: zinc ribbon domain-containing protein [unclassified Enterococcus]|uniref:zinc ribbon domain-containing protein n=1 Tax=unclassified Enterococcus TaxID=2608891 RepID=UPI001A9B5A87|nr:zinc ribbon domain-containing protein [Enterococcus sp. DIV1271a]MBO1301347.1 PH domain-containing protein [Enterococcus sp. DIV1271a]